MSKLSDKVMKHIYINGQKFTGEFKSLTPDKICELIQVPFSNATVTDENDKIIDYTIFEVSNGMHFKVMRNIVHGN